MLFVNETMGDSVLVMYLSFILKKKEKKKSYVLRFDGVKLKMMFSNRFCFLFSKTYFRKYKEKTIFCIFEIKLVS